MNVAVLSLQLWDIRDGMCKQTFSGHESDINAITVSASSFIFSIICTICCLCTVMQSFARQ